MKFRKDINGLRAVAVIAVVLFHFGILRAQGGFLGVDIFFVISGFLMTGIIAGKLNNGSFSLWSFYIDRGRRIVPALIFLCLVLLGAGWFILTPDNYRVLGKHVVASLAFVSNGIFWLEANYFDQASRQKWLLHTWSLSVEWQFYLIYPILLIVLRKLLNKTLGKIIIAVIALISFVFCIYLSARQPTSAFYLLPTRAWEMLAGGLVYFFPVHLRGRKPFIMQLCGICLIGGSIFFFEGRWSGWYALVPVLGAVLLILAGECHSRLLDQPLLQFIGKISYSIYLWHWPIVVSLYYLGLSERLGWVISALGVSIVAGWLSYALIEIPGKSGNRKKGRRAFLLGAGSTTLAGLAVGSVVFASQGFPNRMSADFLVRTKDLVMPLENNGWCFYSVDSIPQLRVGQDGLKCEIGDQSSPVRGLSFGDSYAGQYDPFWHKVAVDNHVRINSIATNWCYPSLTDKFPHPENVKSNHQCLVNRKYLSAHMSDYDFLIFSGAWSSVYARGDIQEVADVVAQAAKKVKLVILMAAPTTYDTDPVFRYENALLLGMPFDIHRVEKLSDRLTVEANNVVRQMAMRYENVIYLDRDSLFNIDGVPSDVSKDNVPYSFGGNHISIFGAKSAALNFEKTRLYLKLQEWFVQIRKQPLMAKAAP